jgi:hypothetical protein
MIGRLMRGETNVVSHRGPVSVGVATSVGGLVLLAVLIAAFVR